MAAMDEEEASFAIAAHYKCLVGENPLWHPLHGALYWTDIPTGRLFSLNPTSGHHQQCFRGPKVGGFTIQADGSLLLFMERGAIAIWDGQDVHYIVTELPDEQQTRFNDVIADPTGRVLCGTMPTRFRQSHLYRLDLDGSVQLILEGVGLSNGLGFSPNGRTLYYADSLARTIYRFHYEPAKGRLGSRDVFASVPPQSGLPDGLTVDAEGCVWSARWGSGALVRYSPEGEELCQLTLPVARVSSVAFGGPDLRDLFVTTAIGEESPDPNPLAGALFHGRARTAGRVEHFSRVLL